MPHHSFLVPSEPAPIGALLPRSALLRGRPFARFALTTTEAWAFVAQVLDCCELLGVEADCHVIGVGEADLVAVFVHGVADRCPLCRDGVGIHLFDSIEWDAQVSSETATATLPGAAAADQEACTGGPGHDCS